jgi:glycolate oxidase iron-sulfur subunit
MPYLDRCLGCLACVTACPSGVPYGELITPFRDYAEARRSRSPLDRLSRLMIHETLPYPGRFRLAAGMGRLASPFQKFLPGNFGPMLELLPKALPPADRLPAVYPALGQRRAVVALLVGCVQQALAPQINRATLRVLASQGVEVVIPEHQGCCGALAMHSGEGDRARALARHNLAIFPDNVDAIITNAAGCGSGMQEYGLLFEGQPEAAQAEDLAKKTMDVTVFLAELGLAALPPLPEPLRVAYHDACHLAHAQGVRAAPRQLLSAIPNLTLLEVPQAEICCGSAGTYNLEQPEIAWSLGERKAANILSTGAQAIATGNIGCLTQIRTHLGAVGQPLPIYHTIELLDRAISAGV